MFWKNLIIYASAPKRWKRHFNFDVFQCRNFNLNEWLHIKDQNAFNKQLLLNSVNLKYKKSTLRFYYENAVKTLFQSEPIPTYYFQFNWVTSHKTWKWLKFNSTVLNWCLKPLKNVKESKQRNVSIFHVYKNATNIFNKVPIHLTIKCFWLDFTVLNHCLKTLKKVKEFKQRNFSIFSLVQVYKNGTNAFNKVSIYPCKYISFIKWFWLKSTVLNWCLRTL